MQKNQEQSDFIKMDEKTKYTFQEKLLQFNRLKRDVHNFYLAELTPFIKQCNEEYQVHEIWKEIEKMCYPYPLSEGLEQEKEYDLEWIRAGGNKHLYGI